MISVINHKKTSSIYEKNIHIKFAGEGFIVPFWQNGQCEMADPLFSRTAIREMYILTLPIADMPDVLQNQYYHEDSKHISLSKLF